MSVAARDGKTSRFFQLAPPGRDQKPASAKRKAAFDFVTKKAPPKLEYSSAAIKRPTPAAKLEADAAGSSGIPKPPEPRIVAWLRAGNADRPETANARAYLMRSAPFLGESEFDAKESMKDAGARWVPNPAKQKGVKDGVISGWWSAYDESVLETLLGMHPITKTTRDGREFTVPPWKPFDCPGKKANDAVAGVLNEFAVYTRVRNDEDRAARKKAHDDREAAMRAKEACVGAGSNDAADILALEAEFGVEWTEDLGRLADRTALLGPAAGVSSVGRVLRGLRLGVVQAEHVRIGRFLDPVYDRTSSATRPATRGTPNHKQIFVSRDDDGPARDYNRVQPDAPVLLYGRSHKWMIWPSNEKQWEKDRVAVSEAAVAHMTGKTHREHRETRCLECKQIVLQQFDGCCSCVEPRAWVECAKCGTYGCHAHQWCACECGWEAWTTHQEQAAREHADLIEQASQQAALASALSEMGVGGGTSDNGNDDGEMAWGAVGNAFDGWFDAGGDSD